MEKKSVRDDRSMEMLRELKKENKRIHSRIAKPEAESISLKNEVSALKKTIDKKASETYLEMLGRIMQRAKR